MASDHIEVTPSDDDRSFRKGLWPLTLIVLALTVSACQPNELRRIKRSTKLDVVDPVSNDSNLSCGSFSLCAGGPQTVKLVSRDEYRNSVEDLVGGSHEELSALVAPWGASATQEGFESAATDAISAKKVQERVNGAEAVAAIALKSAKFRGCLSAGDSGSAWAKCQPILAGVAARAWRREFTAEDSSRLQTLYESIRKAAMGKRNGETALVPEVEGLGAAVQYVFGNPEFIFRATGNAANGTSRKLGPYELASRLSSAVAVSAPDAELLESARTGKILGPGEIRAQAKRLLASPSVRKRFVHNFFAKWFGVHVLRDPVGAAESGGFPLGDYYGEFEAVFDELLRTNRPVEDFLDPGFTYVTDALADLYDLPKTGSTALRRIATHDRGSILQMGALHFVTRKSFTEASPVSRGIRILDGLLCEKTEPLKDVDRKKNDEFVEQFARDAKPPQNPLETWDRIAKASPGCMGCHGRINPLGFPLEAFAPNGRSRMKYPNGSAIDYSGSLYDKPVRVVDDTIRVVRSRPEYVSCIHKRLFGYLTGTSSKRPSLVAGKPSAPARAIGFADLIVQIVSSPAFIADSK